MVTLLWWIAFLAYLILTLFIFVGGGIALGGPGGGAIGYILYLLLAGYGGGYIMCQTGIADKLLGGNNDS